MTSAELLIQGQVVIAATLLVDSHLHVLAGLGPDHSWYGALWGTKVFKVYLVLILCDRSSCQRGFWELLHAKVICDAGCVILGRRVSADTA